MSASVWDDDGSSAIAVATPGPGITALTSVGDGAEVIAGVSELTGAATLKTLVAGNLIEIVESPTQLEFNFTGTPTYTVDNASTSFLFIAEPAQTDFVVTVDVTIELAHVWINGLKLIRTLDFSVTPVTKTITLTTPCSGSERVEVIVAGAFVVEYDLSPFSSLGVEATTLATGEDATATFDVDTNVLSLGLPRGNQGVGLTWRGDYGPWATYNQNDLVAYIGLTYIALQESIGHDPDVSPLYWAVFVYTPNFKGTWSSIVQYKVNDIVYYESTPGVGTSWIAKFDNINSDPPFGDWQMLVTPSPTGNGIDNITRTSGTGAAGTTDTYTITYTDATTDTFTVYNGANGTGDVTGPASSVANRIALFDGVTGKLLKDSGTVVADFAVAAKGVTNGDAHDHSGGDGAQISYSSLASLPDLTVYAKKAGDATIDMNNNNIVGIKTLQLEGLYDNGSKSAGFTLDLNNGQYQKVTFTSSGALTITLTAPTAPGTYTIEFINAGLRTISFAYTSGSPVFRKRGGTAFSSWTASGTDILILKWNGTDYFAEQLLDWKA